VGAWGIATVAGAGGGESVVLAWRRNLACLLLACGALALAAPAMAQGKLEARYRVTLAGIQIGKGNWIVEIDRTHYNAATSGITTGLMHVLTEGEGTSAVRGTLLSGQPLHSIYASTIISRKKRDEVRLTIDNGNVKDFRADPPPDHPDKRVPITDDQRHGVFDPLTAAMMRVPDGGDVLAPDNCRRTLPIFDGRLRYNLQLDFKRLDTVKAEKGYAGPVLVCSVDFSPLGGYIPSHTVVKYLTHLQGIEVWLAPIAGTRVLVPFRVQGPTPIGEAVLEATQFVTAATPTRASAEIPKAH
jgi:Protein of unknown function (DUF3108)